MSNFNSVPSNGSFTHCNALLPSVATLFCPHYPLAADQLCSVLSPPLLDLLDVLDANGAAAAGAEWARFFPGRAFPRNDQ